MVNPAQYSKKILTAFLNQNYKIRTVGTVSSIYNPADYSASSTGTLSPIPFGWPAEVYLGFSSTVPTISETGVVSNFTEPTTGGYTRILLNAIGLKGHKILSDPDFVQQRVLVYDDPVSGSTGTEYTKTVARIRNHEEYIQFPYTGKEYIDGQLNPDAGYGSATMKYYGLFASKEGATPPFIFGELEDEVLVPANVVPIVLEDEFEVTFG